MSKSANINPAILVWARERAGLSVTDAAHQLGFKDSEKKTAAEKLAEFEAGEKLPTYPQLDKLAKLYRRPLITFYMAKPPAPANTGEDFRRPTVEVTRRDNAILETLVRDVRARQELIRDVLEDDPDHQAVRIVGSASMREGIPAFVAKISRLLDFDPSDRSRRRGGAEDLFRTLRAAAEMAGIFVIVAGDLGSHHSAVSTEVFRGFALSDDLAPFVVINDQDSKAGQSFTLIHELTHILMGQSGVSGPPDANEVANEHDLIERVCNDVAGQFLLPDAALTNRPAVDADIDIVRNMISGTAELWSVSEAMVAYRWRRLGWIGHHVYTALLNGYRARWLAYREQRRADRSPESGGPSYYVVRQSKLGNALLGVVYRSLYDNALSHTKAAKVLGVNLSNVEPLLRQFEKTRLAGVAAGRP
ncbi:ImmA/IrrE family metallo-endopeptidase [Pannonibacter phragmitetus]|uniref:DNA-binding protein n=1 Tax=Pannonibacter phragmitetus TaxID=121719 RepID=A0A0U3NGU8_9HYPH|nr:ImmA/IrrE family metallo-endopeptidase [Pannonibacter phragmitetus]ALV28896.1 DNA-binding protein [Pannonibacter phragmitetus]